MYSVNVMYENAHIVLIYVQQNGGKKQMIMKFLNRVPAGMMIVPLLIGAVLNTFCPQVLQLGSLTTATFSNAGAATAMGIQLVCLGTTLQLGDIGKVHIHHHSSCHD